MSDVVIRLGEVEEVPVNVGEEVYIKGDKGNTFFPTVSENGDLSWSNDGGLPNPTTVNIKGPQGEPGNYTKPASGIPKSDLESAVQASLDKADTALQEHQDITGKADTAQNATSGNFAALDENGNLTDSGHKHSDYASSGTGVPSGGSTGQVLKKKSATDYDTEWASAGTADALPLAGGTMSGNINMDGNRVQNLPTPSANGDAVTKSYADGLLTGYRTASAQDVIDTAQDADIASRAKTDMLGIVINGNSTPVGASVGQYVIVKNSTITGVTDGLYKAAKTIPANTAIDATYLTAVSGGGLNDLTRYESLTVTPNTTNFSFESWSQVSANRIGNIVYVRVYGFKPLQATPSGTSFTLATIPGVKSKLKINSPVMSNDGTVQGRCGIDDNSSTVYIASILADNTLRFVSFSFPV